MLYNIKKLLRESIGGDDCDCCKYFDMNSLNRYVEYDKPLYSLISKRRIGELKYVTPKQYIYKIAMGFGGLSYDDALAAYNDEIGVKYSEAMKRGDKFPIGYFTIGNSNQEGRHRAMAAMKLGCSSIPVLAFQEISYDDALEYANAFKDKSFEELDEQFKTMGYKGITKLGYHELQRFIDYNL